MDVVLVVVVVVDGFAVVPVRFVAPANIFSKIITSNRNWESKLEIRGKGVVKAKLASAVKTSRISISTQRHSPNSK